ASSAFVAGILARAAGTDGRIGLGSGETQRRCGACLDACLRAMAALEISQLFSRGAAQMPTGAGVLMGRVVPSLQAKASSLIGGGNKVLLALLERIDRTRFQPLSVIPERGPMEDELRRRDVPYLVADLRPNQRRRVAELQTLMRTTFQCIRHRVGLLHAN